jgi:NTE family protein
MDKQNRRIGLSLSGGGYRAAVFHLGTLNKLNELGVLQKVDVLSTISGGSITGAAWCLHNGDYDSFHSQMKQNLQTVDVIKYIFRSWIFIRTILFAVITFGVALYLSFTNYAWLMFPLLILFFFLLFKFQFAIFPVSKVIEQVYNRFYQNKTLIDFKEQPLLAIGSSNLHTGRPFTFSRVKMSDSSYAYRSEFNPPITFKHEKFPVARAVMASSCVPFAFTPVAIDKKFYKDENDCKRIKPVLVDGGVYDNQGIQKLTQPGSSYECDIIITSDAGGNFIADKKYPNAIALLIRTVDLFMYRIKTAQMVQNIYRNVSGPSKPIAYFSLGWRLDNTVSGFVNNMCGGTVLKEVIDAHGFQKEWVDAPLQFRSEITQHLKTNIGYDDIKRRDLTDEEWKMASDTGTNLSTLSDKRVECLVRQAENLTEAQVKLYCPSLIKTYGSGK